MLRKDSSMYQYAVISQIETAYMEDSGVVFLPYASPFMGEKKPQTQLASPGII
jgi:hypothetical protein